MPEPDHEAAPEAAAERHGDVHLVFPQTDGDLAAAVGDLEDVLRHIATDAGPSIEAEALGELATIIGRFDHLDARPGAPVLAQPVTPDGRFELVPLAFATMPRELHQAALAGLIAIAASGGPDGDDELAELVEDIAGARRRHTPPAGSPGDQLRADAADLAALLRIEADQDYDIVRQALGDPTVEPRRVVLTTDEHAAYKILQGRLLETWHRGDTLARFSYNG